MSVLRVVSSLLCLVAILHYSYSACNDFLPTSSITCQLLFDHFQAALVSRRINLYNLRKTLLPLSRAPPDLVNVTYHVSITPLSDKPCPESEATIDLLPDTTVIDPYFAWTAKTFYFFFHPAPINRLQPQVVQSFLANLERSSSSLAALGWDGVGPILTVNLILDPISLPCRPSFSQIIASLTDITALVRNT